MKLTKVIQVLQQIAPLELAEDWDNVGLLVGDGDSSVKKVMLAIDMTAAVLAEARAKKMDLLVAYHPPIWEGLKRVVAGQGAGPERLIYQAIRTGVAVYAMHTALDCAAGGANDVLADIVGIKDAEPLVDGEVQTGRMYKLVVFLPEGDLEKVSEAVFAAGAGRVGERAKYSKCGFRCRGVGTFEGDAESNPTVGQAGRFEEAQELRWETVVQVLRATFPGGSISGAPKIRAMEIIDELEPTARSVYTGSIGWIGLNGDMDLNIAIRTVILSGGKAHVQAGGAVVADSEAEAEHAETLAKAAALVRALEATG